MLNLCYSLINFREHALKEDGKKQMNYPMSNDGWLTTLFIVEGRALDRIWLPWLLVTMNAIIWTLLREIKLTEEEERDLSSYEIFFGLVLNSSLAFLLVFRLNRSAERFWIARAAWGAMIALARTMVSGVVTHGAHDVSNRDNVIRWIAVFCVATMYRIRGIPTIESDTLAGILSEDEISDFEHLPHPPVEAADRIRWHLGQLFKIRESTACANAHHQSLQLILLEKQLNGLVLQMGALERIKSTPLPLVYVTHLRTFLLLFLFALPYIWGGTLGYATIPIVILTAFALLGLEGAAQEVEAPFQKDRTNHLNMDAFCLVVLNNIQQQIKQAADREIARIALRRKSDEDRAAPDANKIESPGLQEDQGTEQL
jgi:putative membrane protein